MRVHETNYHKKSIIEIPQLHFDEFIRNIKKIKYVTLARNKWVATTNDIIRLMSRDRIISYFNVLHNKTNPELAKKFSHIYHEYKIYNKPKPDPDTRITLIDAGIINSLKSAEKLANFLTILKAEMGHSIKYSSYEEMTTTAIKEAKYYLPDNSELIINSQIEAHHYLEKIVKEPLREDIANFADFIPKKIGHCLEIGSGYGQLAYHLNQRAESYTCLDLLPSMLAAFISPPQRVGVSADAHKLPFISNYFNSVIANNILEHFYDPLLGLQEIKRVLRPGGRLYALIPLDALECQYNLSTHLWKTDKKGIQLAIKNSGLHIVKLKILDLNKLNAWGAFPTCRAKVCRLEAKKLTGS